MTPSIKIHCGDCLDVLFEMKENCIDAVVTDPPYGLSFMGKKWDYDVPSKEIWRECLRVLKPGGYLLAFAGTRTQHRMAVNIEDAGFEIRDMIAWVYGSGFPKSLNIGKAVDKLQGNEREKTGTGVSGGEETHKTYNMAKGGGSAMGGQYDLTKGTSDWEGWGTALKPALEPITVARKPLSEKTVAENALKWGTGGINIDGCRVVGGSLGKRKRKAGSEYGQNSNWNGHKNIDTEYDGTQGRFPANLIHDGSDEVVELFPNDSQRFFYCPKASKSERNKGCEGLEEKQTLYNQTGLENNGDGTVRPIGGMKNNHPTVKPIALMGYLVKLVSRENATVLDPFMGSGTTGIACKNLNRDFIGIERDEDYIKIAKARI